MFNINYFTVNSGILKKTELYGMEEKTPLMNFT